MDGAKHNAALSVDGVGLDLLVEGCASAHQVLLALADCGDDSWMREPSRLPGWSRAHVLTHLARNAESFAHLFDCASRTEVGEQYPGGARERDEAIAAGATRPAGEIVGDLRRWVWALEGRWARAGAATWAGSGRLVSGSTVSMPETVFRRWRETVVHTFDLDVGTGLDEWPAVWVRMELSRQKMAWTATRPMGLGALPAGALALDERRRLAWLIGRIVPEGLPEGPGL